MAELSRAAPVVVVGAGAAGMAAALAAAAAGVDVVLVAPVAPGTGGSTPLAKGGLAAAVGPGDDPGQHGADTEQAGAGLCHPGVVASIVGDAPAAAAWLVACGLVWDPDPRHPDRPALGREGGHHRRRILHAGGDRSGWHLAQALAGAVAASERIEVVAGDAVELLVGVGASCSRRVGGVLVEVAGDLVAVHAPSTIVATGGLGGLFAATTNPADVRGHGLALAARAGARLADVELVQFHPTALAVGTDPLPLLSEALRGDGAHLVDGTGAALLVGHHPDGDLAPRDVAARAVHTATRAGRGAFLDLRPIGERLPAAFPAAWRACVDAGLDPSTAPVPVVAAAHYAMGGIATEVTGATSLPGLWAAGEVARTGLHGANRLASNSLLEAVVVGRRAGSAAAGAAREHRGAPAGEHLRPAGLPRPGGEGPASAAVVAEVRRLLDEVAGPSRRLDKLAAGRGRLTELAAAAGGPEAPRRATDALAVADAVVRGALARTTSVGAHHVTAG